MLEAPAIIGIAVIIVLLILLWGRTGAGSEEDVFYDPSDGERQPHKWGYTDTRFEFDGPRSVRVTGSRYPLAGYSMPHFIPFAEEVLGVPITPEGIMPEVERETLPPRRQNDPFEQGIGAVLGTDQVATTDDERLVHSHGQLSVDDR